MAQLPNVATGSYKRGVCQRPVFALCTASSKGQWSFVLCFHGKEKEKGNGGKAERYRRFRAVLLADGENMAGAKQRPTPAISTFPAA